ncbi:MAG: Ig-like domain-containing protein [Arenicellales bacterium WSBS_2016_MAG_OTU3]
MLLFGAPTTADSIATFEVTATFSEPVTGFDEEADVTISYATATISGSGDTYTLTITPDGTDGEIRISIAARIFAMDGADNGDGEASTGTQ